MLTKIQTATLMGIEGHAVTVETDLHNGMPGFNIVGLADTTIREACQRIKPAIMNCGYLFPRERVTVNLVPAGSPKEGSHFDLPIALGVMMLGQDTESLKHTAFLGEVSLDGTIHSVKGVLPLAICLRRAGIKRLVLPASNAEEASILEDLEILPVTTLREAVAIAEGEQMGTPYLRKETPGIPKTEYDYSQVVGQESVKRAITIGAAGAHGILMIGSPGSGKSMMAKRIPSILPELTYEEKLEITGIYSVAGLLDDHRPVIEERPFRSPHHTITKVGLLGGGARPRPGELSLAHRGVLFLDELGEFDSKVIDSLRQPIEDQVVHITRQMGDVLFPSQVMLVVAANPCKCGNLWDDKKVCSCTSQQLESHRRKLMGPFADRIDMHIKVNPVTKENLIRADQMAAGMSSAQMREMVLAARERQDHRFRGTGYRDNGSLDERGIKAYCVLTGAGEQLLREAFGRLGLTMRGYHKILKMARTVADLEGADRIAEQHVAEALMYRPDIWEQA